MNVNFFAPLSERRYVSVDSSMNWISVFLMSKWALSLSIEAHGFDVFKPLLRKKTDHILLLKRFQLVLMLMYIRPPSVSAAAFSFGVILSAHTPRSSSLPHRYSSLKCQQTAWAKKRYGLEQPDSRWSYDPSSDIMVDGDVRALS